MLFRLGKLFAASVAAPDGEIGRVTDVYFDEQRWTVRYLVVDTEDWPTGGRVLIASNSVRGIDWDRNLVRTELTRFQIGASPNIDPHSPAGPLCPLGNARGGHGKAQMGAQLRSLKDVAGYQLLTSYDCVGRVEDFILDNASWTIRYFVIDTNNWLPGRHVVIPPQWSRGVDWMERLVNVEISRSSVQTAPEYHSALALSRLHETNLYSHYQRPGYWQ